MVAQSPPQTEEGKKLLGDIAKAEQQVIINQAPEFYNLVPDLDEGLVREISQQVKKGFEDDDQSRQPWLDMHEFWLRLYTQTDYALNTDDERDWGATESVPILTEAADQFQSRTYKAFFPSEKFVSAIPQAYTQDPVKHQLLSDRADRVARHMSWQLGVQNKNFKRDKRTLFLGTAIHGSFFTKTYFDAYKKKRPCVDNVRPTDLVINYTYGAKSIEDVRRKSHVIDMTVGETQTLAIRGWLASAASANYEGTDNSYTQAVNEAQGIIPGNHLIKGDAPCTLIEQQFYLDIDGTGYPVPYLGTIDHPTGKLLRLVIDYEADKNGNPTKDYEQIQYYTHYKYMENPDGFYGLGLGAKIGDLNAAININMRQMLDAATLATAGNASGFISNRLCYDGEEEMSMTLGKFKKVPDSVGDIKNGISMMQFSGPNQAQMELMQFLDGRAQRIAATTDVTTGDISKNMQPTTVLAQIEQAMEQFSSVQEALKDDFSDELQKIYRLNSKHLPFTEYFAINGVPDAITRDDYAEDMIIHPVFDPKFATRAQKVAKAQAELDATMKNPLNQTRPWIYDIAFRRYLEALDTDNINELIPPTPVEVLANAYTQFQAQQAAGQQQAQTQPGTTQGVAGAGGNPMATGTVAPVFSSPTGASAPQGQSGMPNGQLQNGVTGGLG